MPITAKDQMSLTKLEHARSPLRFKGKFKLFIKKKKNGYIKLGYKYSVSDCIKGASVILHYPPPASTGSGRIDLASCLVRAGLQKQDTAAVRAKTGSAGRSASCSFSVHAVNTSRLLTALTRDEEEAVMCD